MNQNKQQERNEILFFKVFHNKYLRKLILKQIETINVEKEISKLTRINYNRLFRVKFKDISYFKFLIEEKLYQLLKLKIIHNEKLVFDNHGLEEFIKLGSSKDENEFKEFEEILKLLYRYKRNYVFKEFDLLLIQLEMVYEIRNFSYYSKTSLSTTINNLKVFKVLTSPPYSIKITPKLFEYLINGFNKSFCDTDVKINIIQEFIKISNNLNQNIISDHFKKNLMDIVSNIGNKNLIDTITDYKNNLNLN